MPVSMGKKIYNRRKALGLKQAQVCEYASINDKTLSEIENDHTIPNTDTVIKLCSVLDLTPNDLLLSDEDDFQLEKSEIFSSRYKIISKNVLKEKMLLAMMDAIINLDVT